MRSLVEVSIEKEELDDQGDVVYEKKKAWLLHFGVDNTLVETEHGVVPVSYTVAICQDIETGQIQCFRPEVLRVLGTETKK
jgi:hypothetical protein